jgi:hypothetical protein
MFLFILGYGLGWCYNHRPKVAKFLKETADKIDTE